MIVFSLLLKDFYLLLIKMNNLFDSKGFIIPNMNINAIQQE
jgi:hypothetical protein